MYSRQESSQLRQEFWTVFGQYMSPILSAEGEKINWINYKTGERNIHFKMETHSRFASIVIELSHPDTDTQQIYFDQFITLKNLLSSSLEEEWNWTSNEVNNETGKIISKIFITLDGKSVLNKSDWPDLISFFKPRIIKLDQFWSSARYAFELLH